MVPLEVCLADVILFQDRTKLENNFAQEVAWSHKKYNEENVQLSRARYTNDNSHSLLKQYKFNVQSCFLEEVDFYIEYLYLYALLF